MKRKLFFALLILFMLVFTLTATACGEHTHVFDRKELTEEYKLTDATCLQKAVYYYSCECGEKGTQTFEYGDALGHSFTNYVSDNNATCTADGTKTAKCDRCDVTNTIADVNSKIGHSFTNYVSNGDATYDADGTKTALCDNGCGATDTITDVGTKLEGKIEFTTLSVSDDKVYGKVSNSTEAFSFINEVKTYGSKTKFVVSRDVYGENQIASKTVALNVGDNVVYVFEMYDGEPKNVYQVTIRRKPIYNVSFDTADGTAIESQQVEEDALATKPTENPTKLGYDFNDWDYNFSSPIVQDTVITAKWNIVTYNIIYKLDGNEIATENPGTYTIEDAITLSLPQVTKTGYNASWRGDGKIEKGSTGNKTFEVIWTPIEYTITYNCGYGTTSNVTSYTIESETITLSDAYYESVGFVEWQCEGQKITEILSGSYGNKELTAIWREYNVKLSLNDDGTYAVTGLNTDETSVAIANSYDGKKVTAIAKEAFKHCSCLTDITLPNSIVSIENYAFYCCTGLTSITIPDSVTSIEEYAFYGCTGLTSITIPDSVTSIEEYAFCYCTGLTSITIPSSVTSIEGYAFCGCSNLERITVEEGNKKYCSINNCLIETSSKTLILGCQNSVIPTDGSVTSIGYNAFYNCTGLTSITIPNSVTSIEGYAFYGCSNLERITVEEGNKKYCSINNCLIETSSKTLILGCQNSVIPTDGSVTSIEEYAFCYCTGLTSITIPSSVTSIGGYAFYYCTGLTSITIPNSVTTIGNFAFCSCTDLTSITIPSSVTSIEGYAFCGCSNLERITVEEGNKKYCSINNCLIETSSKTLILGCQNSVIPTDGSVTSIGVLAFYNCTGLTSITIPNSVTTIAGKAFSYCTGLTSITIPNSVTTIGYCAFGYCTGLTSITIPSSVTSIWDGAFNGCGNLERITVEKGNKKYCSINNCLIETSSKTLILGCQNSVIPTDGSVTSIGDDAFWGRTSLTSITIPSSVTSIGDHAFYDCTGLTSITIPNSVTSIGYCAFGYCTGLTSITIPSSVTSIGDHAFYDCTGLTSITIPNTVASINKYFVFNCTKLKQIVFNGTVKEFLNVFIGENMGIKVICLDGNIYI